jgi:hypothetical protein
VNIKKKYKDKQTTPEESLDFYWKQRLGNGKSAFTGLSPFYTKGVDASLLQLRNYLAEQIFIGLPLAQDDYYHAIAFHFLLTELPYDKFYKTQWHETADHLGYGPTCSLCKGDHA